MEALATLCLLLLEKRKGANTAESMLDAYRGNLLEKSQNGQTVESAGPLTFGSRLEIRRSRRPTAPSPTVKAPG